MGSYYLLRSSCSRSRPSLRSPSLLRPKTSRRIVTGVFLIDRPHENVYDPDNGTMQHQGPGRSYGWELKTSALLAAHLSWNAGLTQVSNAFFLGANPRQYVDSAPHSVANSSHTLNDWHGVFSSIRYRYIGHYLLINPDDASVPPTPLCEEADLAGLFI